jgi:hypothetical protein
MLIAVFTDQILVALQALGPEFYVLIGAIIALVVVGATGMRTWLAKRRE